MWGLRAPRPCQTDSCLTPWGFVRAYAMFREWLTVPIRPDGRGDRRLPTGRVTLPRNRLTPVSNGIPPKGRFDATITFHGHCFGVVHQDWACGAGRS